MGPERGSGDVVIATYREIAQHFGLTSGPDAGRLKARRAGWFTEPGNHPRDPARVQVPREAWDAANPVQREPHPPPEPRSEAPFAELLTTFLARLEEREAAALREARELAERRGEEIAELRERVGRTEAQRDRADQWAAAAEAERDKAQAERAEAQRKAEENQAALVAWEAGGPFARALRAFLHRRR
jgi:pyruvate/2-oxoglutarate dehydrogenase complex dihydrolipoamide acyltransferase (E2) component